MIFENLTFQFNFFEDILRFLEEAYLYRGKSVYLSFVNDEEMDAFDDYISDCRYHYFSNQELIYAYDNGGKCIIRQFYHSDSKLCLINNTLHQEMRTANTSGMFLPKCNVSDIGVLKTEEYYCGIKIERFEDFIANPILWYAEMEHNCSDDDCEDSISKELDEFLSSFEDKNKKENANGKNDPVQQMR